MLDLLTPWPIKTGLDTAQLSAYKNMFHHKMKNAIVVSGLQFCIFKPQPAIQLLQQWWSGGRFVGGYGRK